MLCSIQTYKHIGMPSIKFYINYSMHSSCYDIYICYITFKHIYILVHLVMKIIIKHVTHHHRALHAFHSFSSHLGANGYAIQRSFIS